MTQLCEEEHLVALMKKVEADNTSDVSGIDDMIDEYPNDPRLHFLRGSILANSEHLVEAHSSMQKAVELAPEFHIARFQLGFFELSSGEPQAALENWQPLNALPDRHYLKSFVVGLTFLIQDEFEQCVSNLRRGILSNQENPPLNHDMQLIIDKCNDILSEGSSEDREESISSTSLLLNQFSDSDKPN